MKIVNHRCPNSKKLSTIGNGVVVKLCEVVHNKHNADDFFIINEVCSTYQPKSNAATRKYSGKAIALTNLRTGSLAYLDPERQAVLVDCELSLC